MFNKIYDPIFNALLLKPNCNNSNELFKTTSSVFLFIMTMGFIMNMHIRFKLLLNKKLGTSYIMYLLIKILTDTFILLFMYNACLTCNGLYGLLYMMIFLFITDLILGIIFKHILKKHGTKNIILLK